MQVDKMEFCYEWDMVGIQFFFVQVQNICEKMEVVFCLFWFVYLVVVVLVCIGWELDMLVSVFMIVFFDYVVSFLMI